MSHAPLIDDREWQALAALADDPLVYKHLFDNAIVGICFMAQRRFIRVNRRMEELFGYAPGALEGRSVRLLYPSEDEFRAIGERLAATAVGTPFVHEHPLVAKDGSLRWCQISGRSLAPGEAGSPSVWVVQDISARKAAEDQLARANARLEQRIAERTRNLQKTNEALRLEVNRRRDSERTMIESREKYRVLLRNIPLGIAVTDVAGNIVEVNPVLQGWLDARSFEDFLARAETASFEVAGEGTSMPLAMLIRSRLPTETRRPDRLAVRWTRPSGQALWFDVVGVRVPVSGLGAAVVFTDQTAQRQARDREITSQQQLAHAARLSAMGQLASALAHELGQPLNASLSYAAGIGHHLAPVLPTYPQAAEALDFLQRHLRQAGDVIRNVRAFLARHRPESEAIDMAELARQTRDLLHLQIRERGTRVEIEADAELPCVTGNRVELQQVLVNLVANALEALRDHPVREPRIRIRISAPRRGEVQVVVVDNGPGIPEDFRDTAFEPYRTTKTDGLGLGLALCRNIVESHGGRLALDRRVRRGASFRLVLKESGHHATSPGTRLPR